MFVTIVAIFSLLANLYFLWAIKQMAPSYRLGQYIAKGIVNGTIKTARIEDLHPTTKSNDVTH